MLRIINGLLSILLMAAPLTLAADCSTDALATSHTIQSTRLIAYLSLEKQQNNPTPEVTTFNINGSRTTQPRPAGRHLELLNIKVDDKRVMQMYLMVDNRRIRPLLTELLSYYDKKNGGLSTLDGLHVTWPKPTDPTTDKNHQLTWPVISLTQTSMPAKGDSNFRPGAPQLSEFEYNNDVGCYEEI